MKKENKKNKEKFENDFDKLFVAKRQGNFAVIAVITLAVFCVVGSLGFSFFVLKTAYSQIAVIDTGGRYLQTTIEDQEVLERELIKQSCANITYYINSFDRNGYLFNYDKAKHYCVTSELNKITEVYEADKLYYDAIERGVIFSCELTEIHEVATLKTGDIRVSFNSLMTRKDGAFSEKYIIESEGILSRVTPQFPDNTTGWSFTRYLQKRRSLNENVNYESE